MADLGKSNLIIWVEYLAALALWFIVSIVPYRVSLVVAKVLGLAAYRVLHTWRKVAIVNLGIAFASSLSEGETRRIAQGAFVNFAQTIVELVYFLDRPADAVFERTVCDGIENLMSTTWSNWGVIVCSAHLSNWYWPGLYAACWGIPLSVIIRPLDNPLLDRWVRTKLERRGITPIPRDPFSLQSAVDALGRGELLGLMIDQNSAVGGRFVPFFGTRASTMRGVAYFSGITDAAVVLVHDIREKGRHRVVISKPIDLPDDEELALLTINRHFEDVIRQHRDKYFWLHPRWKRRPSNEDSLYPGLRI